MSEEKNRERRLFTYRSDPFRNGSDKNTQIAELVVIHDMKESKNLGVVAAVVVFRVIILNYAMFYLGTGIYEEDLSPCWSSHREQSR